MHEQDLLSCVPATACYPSPDVPKMDDRAALSRLYPVTSANLSQFPGKLVFSASTGRIHGSVKFTDSGGNPAQPMQGVNVVARCANCPPGGYAASSVSGFLFSGNAGNAVTGYTDALGNDYSRFGSTDPALEGFFDLGGLEIPNGMSAQYQLTVEAIDGQSLAKRGAVRALASTAIRNCATHHRERRQGKRFAAGHPHDQQRSGGPRFERAGQFHRASRAFQDGGLGGRA